MAILRSKEIAEMAPEELDEQVIELRKDLMKINGILASGGIPEDVGKAREIKRTIARILTHKRLLEMNPNLLVKEEKPKAPQAPKGSTKSPKGKEASKSKEVKAEPKPKKGKVEVSPKKEIVEKPKVEKPEAEKTEVEEKPAPEK